MTSGAHDALYAVNVDEGTLSRIDVASGAVTEIEVGREPTRVTRAKGRVYVSLRAERGVAVLEERDGGLVMVDRIETGAEPVGLIANEAGTRLYVAASTQNVVQEFDLTEGGALLREFVVPGSPMWLALHPSGDGLYVGSAFGGLVTFLDVSQAEVTPQEYPFPDLSGAGEDQDEPFTRRFTGDPAFDASGEHLAIPGLWVDNLTPTTEPDDGTVSIGGGYASSTSFGLSRMNPGLAIIDVDGHGRPTDEAAKVVFVAGFSQLDERSGSTAVRSYLSSATWAPDGETIYATMEASNTVVALASTAVYGDQSLCRGCEDIDVADTGGSVTLLPSQGGFLTAPAVFVGTGVGPRGVAFVDEGHAYVHTWLDRSVASLKVGEIGDGIASQLGSGSAFEVTGMARLATAIATPSLDPEVEAGRRLFYSAVTPQMVTSGAGVSCSTCHLDGRTDGVTWALEDGPRATPTLAGKVSLTLPLTWTSDVDSVATEAEITSQNRMGGTGITEAELASIATFVDFTRHADLPAKGLETDAILRGKALFEREDVACASCHSGALFTDNTAHTVYGVEKVNTPTLVGIAASAPYLHTGGAATLRDVLESARGGAMGDTSALSDDDMDDLVAYLESL